MQNLYVDSFLGYAALAVGCVALSDEAFSRGGIALQATAGAVLVLTKMSGVFLLIPHLVLLFLRRRVLPEKERRSVRWILLILAGVFTAAFLSYSLYAKFTFPAVAGRRKPLRPGFPRRSGRGRKRWC